MMARIGFPSSHVAYRQLVPYGDEDFTHRRPCCSVARLRGDSVSRLVAILGRHGHPHYRGFRLPLADARTRLVLAARFCVGRVLRGRLARLGAGLSLRACSGCGLTGCGCVLRTASANILCRSALVGAEGLVMLPPFEFAPSLAERSTFTRRQEGAPQCLEMTILQQQRAAVKTTG